MGSSDVLVQWPVTKEFVDLLLASLKDVTPTPLPPLPTPTATPVLAKHGISFHQPGGTVRWGGPDDAVSTKGGNHCSVPSEMDKFGLPMYIHVKPARWFLADRIVVRQDGWHWTGYYRGDWQIWQGDDSHTVYIVNAGEPRIAFQYIFSGCA